MKPVAVSRVIAALVPLMAVLGCDRSSVPPDAPSTPRSATLSQEMRIDGHVEDLVPVGAVAVREDGTIAITQPQDGLVRLYSAQGDAIGAFGREGEGPGEFLNPLWMAWRDSTLSVYDGRLRRLTTISSALHVVSTSSLAPTVTGAGHEFSNAFARGLGNDSSLLAGISASDDFYLGAVGQDGVVRRVLARLPEAEHASVAWDAGTARLPFANEPQYGISPQGDRIGIAMATLDGPSAETFLLTVVAVRGDTLMHRRYPFEGDPIPAEEADSIISARVTRLPSTEAIAAVRRATRVPPVYPPLTAVLIGTDGSIWVEMRSTSAGRPYYVIAPDGELIGTATLPSQSRIAAATLQQIHVLDRDEMDVQSLVRYEVGW